MTKKVTSIKKRFSVYIIYKQARNELTQQDNPYINAVQGFNEQVIWLHHLFSHNYAVDYKYMYIKIYNIDCQ